MKRRQTFSMPAKPSILGCVDGGGRGQSLEEAAEFGGSFEEFGGLRTGGQGVDFVEQGEHGFRVDEPDAGGGAAARGFDDGSEIRVEDLMDDAVRDGVVAGFLDGAFPDLQALGGLEADEFAALGFVDGFHGDVLDAGELAADLRAVNEFVGVFTAVAQFVAAIRVKGGVVFPVKLSVPDLGQRLTDPQERFPAVFDDFFEARQLSCLIR